MSGSLVASLVARVPLGMRVKYVLNSLGLENEDIRGLDALVDDVLNTPAVAVLTGRDLRSVTDVVSWGFELYEGSEGKFDRMQALLPAASQFLATDEGRMKASKFILQILTTPEKHRDKVADILSKMVRSGVIPGEYQNVQEWLAHGVLPLVASRIPVKHDHGTTCELCGHVQGTPL